jgi:hypothetical protein
MAKITYDPDEGPLEAEVFARTKGAVHIQCHDDEDNKKATSALESAGMKVFLPYAEVTKAQCCLTLNAEDLKFLQENLSVSHEIEQQLRALLLNKEGAKPVIEADVFTPSAEEKDDLAYDEEAL